MFPSQVERLIPLSIPIPVPELPHFCTFIDSTNASSQRGLPAKLPPPCHPSSAKSRIQRSDPKSKLDQAQVLGEFEDQSCSGRGGSSAAIFPGRTGLYLGHLGFRCRQRPDHIASI